MTGSLATPAGHKVLFSLTLIAVITNTSHFVFNYTWPDDVIYLILLGFFNLPLDYMFHEDREPSFKLYVMENSQVSIEERKWYHELPHTSPSSSCSHCVINFLVLAVTS